MNKQTTRAFAAGLFVTAILLFGFKPFLKENNTNSESETEIPQESTLKEEDFEKLEKQVQYWKTEYERLASKDMQETEQHQLEVETAVKIELVIEEGMNSTEVSQLLANEQIITDANDLDEYLEARNLQRYIQIGTYEVSNQMSLGEIAGLITKK